MTDKEFLKQLGLKLKCQRIMAELTVKDVANKTGLNEDTILFMERGIRNYTILNLKKVVSVYGGNLKDLF